MRVIYSPASLRDLEEIGDFIGLDNRRRSRRFVAELRAACRSLGSESLRYPLQPQWAGARRMPVGNYLVLYRVLDDRVQIVRVLNSAQDLNALRQSD